MLGRRTMAAVLQRMLPKTLPSVCLNRQLARWRHTGGENNTVLLFHPYMEAFVKYLENIYI